MQNKSTLAIISSSNSPGKRDATGAFVPEARNWCIRHSKAAGAGFDMTGNFADRRREVAMELTARAAHRERFDSVAFFCHGWRDGIQAGYKLAHVDLLSNDLRALLTPGGVVALWACDAARDSDADRADDVLSTADGFNGFASRLAVELKVPVFAHATPGHTTTNPYAMRFGPDGRGEWYVAPGSSLWKAWRRELRENAEFRFALPYISPEAARAALVSGR